jgi:hypothetical protein
MNAIRSVFAALSNLAASINELASVFDVATCRLRQQLALDGESAPILEHQPLGDPEDTPLPRVERPKPEADADADTWERQQGGASPALFV